MNKPVIYFNFYFLNDGTSTSVSINLSTQPVFIQSFNNSTTANSIDLAAASGVGGLTCDSGATVTSSSLLLGVLTVNLSSAGIVGETNIITGYLKF